MIATLLEQERIISFLLPKIRKEVYWIKDLNSNDTLLSIESMHGKWIAKSTSHMKFVDENNNHIDELCLHLLEIYSVRNIETNEIGHLFIEPATEDWRGYKRYWINTVSDICIGRDRKNEICYNNISVSSVHVRLSRRGNRWVLYDENSLNGVYVNNIRVHKSCLLQPGDMIYIMGLRIIVGKGFIALNNPEKMVIMSEDIFIPFRMKKIRKLFKNIDSLPEYYVPHNRHLPSDNDYYSIEQCKDIIRRGKANLWERNCHHDDFLKLKVGKKNCVIDLKQYPMIGVKAGLEEKLAFCKGMLLQIITYYAYTDLKIIFLLDQMAENELKAARWLPHIWDNQKQQSFYVKTSYEAKKLSAFIKKQYNRYGKHDKTNIPYYIIFGFDRVLEQMLNIPGIRDFINFSFVSFLDDSQHVFSSYDMLLDIGYEAGSIINLRENTKQEFVPDIFIREDINLLYLQLANTQLNLGPEYEKCSGVLMIELYVPALGSTYDISIAGNCRVGESVYLIEKQIIMQNKDYVPAGGEAVLCDTEDGVVLDGELTLEESGVLNGTRLMLI